MRSEEFKDYRKKTIISEYSIFQIDFTPCFSESKENHKFIRKTWSNTFDIIQVPIKNKFF